MSSKLIKRILFAPIKDLSEKFQVVFLAGPRRSGKTSILKHFLSGKFEYLSLEEKGVLEFALNDPRGFFSSFKNKLIIDDIHKAPHLIPLLKDIHGTYILSGRLDSSLSKKISLALKGRAVKLSLLPFSLSESFKAGTFPKKVNDWLFTGSYPERFSQTQDFYHTYISELIEKDIKAALKIHGINKFRRFLHAAAAFSGVPINLTKLGEETLIDARTANSWITILEELYILFRLYPYPDNSQKRKVKTPKLLFYDSGLLCFLLGITRPEDIHVHPMRAKIFETAVISEITKRHFFAGFKPKLYYWQDLDNKTKEINLIEDHYRALQLTEIQFSQTSKNDYSKNLLDFSCVHEKIIKKQVIYDGDDISLDDVVYYNWKSLKEA